MTLRARLTLFFTGIVIVPLLAASFVLQTFIGRELERRSESELRIGAQATSQLWQERIAAADREARAAAAAVPEARERGALDEEVARLRAEGELDFLIVSIPEGVLASEVADPRYLPGVPAPGVRELTGPGAAALVLRAEVDVLTADETLTVTGGFYADQRLAQRFAGATGLDVVLTSEGGAIASTISTVPPIPAGVGVTDLSDDRRGLASEIPGHDARLILVVTQETEGLRALVWVVVLAGLALAMIFGYFLAGLLARPMERLAEGAKAVAAGDLETHVDAEGQGDVARLAESFNAMTDHLRQYVGELERSRDELRSGLDRLGATLRSTLDLEGMLAVILDTAAITLQAKAGAVFLLSPSGRSLRLEVARGFDPAAASSVRVGRGIAGRAGRGLEVLIPSEDAPSREPMEPSEPTAVAVPLIRGERTMGVLALYGRGVPEPYTQEDVESLASFAAQASVAIENVLLHQEAERLSITDGLTGVWNRRYLQLTLGKEIERAQRFERPLSLLMVDIDHFKDVNDKHGHPVGDGVLIEVAQRTLGTIRSQIDALTRYGGEEFVVVLPETPREGALVVAEKILTAMRDVPFCREAGLHIDLTVSVGVASFPDDGTTADDLVRSADLALYRAKNTGRDRAVAAGA